MAGQDERVRPHKPMSSAELDYHLGELGIAQSELADLLCVSPRAVRRYLAQVDRSTRRGIPMPVAILVRLLGTGAVDSDAVRKAGDGV